ncbi:MAG: hypothetical protein KF812_01920 [Fimbriimonadaceae bacterium]|nr:hypothetical protein [Fimbriimonadaceae bacterium]
MCSAFVAAFSRQHVNDLEPFRSNLMYFQVEGVMALQQAGLVVSLAIIVLTSLWFFTPKIAPFVRLANPILALTGIVLAWVELLRAKAILQGAPFEISSLPYGPINNLGLWGVLGFATYLFLRMPDGRLGANRGTFVKLGLAACFFLANLLLWSLIAT